MHRMHTNLLSFLRLHFKELQNSPAPPWNIHLIYPLLFYSYPMELHMVFFNEDYNNIQTAQQYSDGLAVLAYFFEVIYCYNFDFITE